MTTVIEIKINPEYDNIYKRYFDQDTYNSLKRSIKMYGQHNPITVNSEGIILDGHNRFKACLELALEIKYDIRDFPNKLLEKLFVYDCNLERRNLNKFCRVEIELERAPLLQEIARENSLNNLKQGKNSPSVNSFTLGRVDEEIGNNSGVSYKTVWKVRKIQKHADDDLVKKLRKGETTIEYGFQMINRADDHKAENIPELPQGQFDIILADPPWQYDVNLRGTPEIHYQTMNLEDIKLLAIPSADHSILFLWTTVAMLKKSLEVMDYWGFEYKTHMVWVKDKIGNGYYFRGQHEILLLGKKGNQIPTPEEKNRPSSVIQAPRTEHSKKPDQVHDIIEKMYPNRKYLELFARRERENWTVWGNQLP